MNTQPAANDDTLDLSQAAELLHIGFKAMKELVDTGEVPALSCNQKHCVLLREDLISYVREQGRKQADKRRQRKQQAAIPTPAVGRRRGGKTAMPNLDAYEVTTVGQKA